MRPVVVTVGPLAAASPTAIALSQLPVSGQPIALNGPLGNPNNPAVLDKPRQVLLTYGTETVAQTIVLKGTNWTGQVVTEVLQVPAMASPGTIGSVLDYQTLISAFPGTNATVWANPITLGTSLIAGSQWVNFDQWAFASVTIQVNVYGSLTYTLQTTLDDPNSLTNPVLVQNIMWVNSNDPAMVNGAVTAQSNFQFAPIWAKLVMTGGAGGGGSATATFWQAGDTPRR